MIRSRWFQKALALLPFAILFSCQSKTTNQVVYQVPASARLSASAEEDDYEEQHRQTFVNLMNEANDKLRTENIGKFFNTQRSFFYIAQGLMDNFDEKLDHLYQKKQKGETISAEEFQIFNEMRFKNLIAWEFSERNLYEMVDLYAMGLQSANNKDSLYFKNSRKILKDVEKWFAEGWENGDHAAIIQLAQHFDDVNDEVLKSNRKAWLPKFDFKKFTQLSKVEMEAVYKQSAEFNRNRKKGPFDYFIEKKWHDHLTSRESLYGELYSQLYDSRTPQGLDTLEPDPGPNGHVTGNRFPMGKWAFTFDDGPHPVHTLGMYNNLKSTGTIGTFFWLSQNIIKYPELVKQAGTLGFSRASHSYTHANLPTLAPAALNHEINDAITDFTRVVGAPPTMFRCPYGACGGNGSNIRQMIAGHGALEIFWNVDTLDWQDKNPASVFQRGKKQVDLLGRGIILFHDIHPQSVIASKMLIDYIKGSQKFSISSLKELIGESRGKVFESP